MQARQQGEQRARRYAEQAVDLLKQSLAAGLPNTAQIETDADLDPVRAHPEFAAVLRQAKLDRRYGGVWHAVADREGAVGGQEVTRVLVVLVEDRLPESGLDGTEELHQFVVAYHVRFEIHGESLSRDRGALRWELGRAFAAVIR